MARDYWQDGLRSSRGPSAYRAYASTTPVTSRLLKKRWDEMAYSKHRDALQKVRPIVDNRPPKTYVHLFMKLKWYQMQEERRATIQRDNFLLLQRMANIMQTRGRIDNINNYIPRSLNGAQRMENLVRIAHENQGVLKRIQYKEPNYHHLDWARQWKESRKHYYMIRKFPESAHPIKKPTRQAKPQSVKKSDPQSSSYNQTLLSVDYGSSSKHDREVTVVTSQSDSTKSHSVKSNSKKLSTKSSSEETGKSHGSQESMAETKTKKSDISLSSDAAMAETKTKKSDISLSSDAALPQQKSYTLSPKSSQRSDVSSRTKKSDPADSDSSQQSSKSHLEVKIKRSHSGTRSEESHSETKSEESLEVPKPPPVSKIQQQSTIDSKTSTDTAAANDVTLSDHSDFFD